MNKEVFNRAVIKLADLTNSRATHVLMTAAIYFEVLSVMPPSEWAMLTSQIAAATIWFCGAILDEHSTLRTIELNEQFKEAGEPYRLIETSPLYPKLMTKDEFVKRSIPIGVAGTAISIIIPPAGVAWGVGKTVAALNNYRLAKRGEAYLKSLSSELN